ncbi:OmpA family protein [Ancylomarina longa]|uniref:Tetratricopeptide repeat protein n=1 Tax=Ancylomarina longa TaxID=2487017 RepID=A0A434AVV7_9BACT|nr:OmpA family protein [Ancylomarina longa]RUT78622.1 tetratricopeptide repeat protein [Ancylomarina longa]
MQKPLLIFFLLVIIGSNSIGQKKYSVKSKKAISYYEMAAEHYRNREDQKALQDLNNAIHQKGSFVEAWLFKADVLHALGKTKEEILAYQKAIAIDAAFFPTVHFNLGNAYLKIGKYALAKAEYKDFLAYPNISVRNKSLASKRSDICKHAIAMMENPVDFHPVNLGAAINSENDEYWPSLTADESVLVFTRLSPKKKEVKLKWQEDFWFSVQVDSIWQPAKMLSANINTSSNEGAQSITADGRYMYFTACNRPEGLGRCDIYYAVREGENWSTPINLGKPINTAAWEAQPSISADGRILYFVSNRKSGKGKMDIWQSYLQETMADGRQRWSSPINVSINTRDNEMSPFIHASNQYLVFATDGREGMGGFDLYKSIKTVNGNWSKPKNMGYPINTYGDEIGLVINAKGDRAYFSSDRLEGKGKDIFAFDLPVELQPPSVSWLKGKVFDADNKKPLYASVLLIDLVSKDTLAQIHSDQINGKYLLCLPAGKEYLFAAEVDNYLFYSDHFSLLENQQKSKPQRLDIPLQSIKSGNEVVLRNVFFDLDSWEILPQSEIELNRLLLLLQNHLNLKIEIGGYTDNTGTTVHNTQLSRNRAKAVCDYLISKGVVADRLSYKGYGSDKPISSNNSAKGRALNRRTEFRIIGDK